MKAPKKAALASWIGSAVEYYDFFIYGTAAALVFGKVFFPSSDPAMGTILAFATFGVGYLTRPIGAVILGHVGDKFGRKKVLTFTLLLMGLSTFLVGLLPTYNQVGVLAPILLVFLRLLQGVSAAGEQAGASSMTLEHAPSDRRAFFTSFTLSGTQGGLIPGHADILTFVAIVGRGHAELGLAPTLLLERDRRCRRVLGPSHAAGKTPAFKEEEAAHVVAKLPVAVLFRESGPDVLRGDLRSPDLGGQHHLHRLHSILRR